MSGRVLEAREALARLDFPTTRQENWKYTRTGRISQTDWRTGDPHAPVSASSWCIAGLDAIELVFVNGSFRPDLSAREFPAGTSIQTAGAVAPSDPAGTEPFLEDFFTALHIAHCTDALFLDIRQSASPFHLVFVQTGDEIISQPHVRIHVAPKCDATIIASFCSEDGSRAFTNAQLECEVSDHAGLNVIQIQREKEENSLILRTFVSLGTHSRASVHTHTTSGGWVRNDLHMRLLGQGGEAHLYGTYFPRLNQHVDNHTLVDHRVAHCESNELYKGVVADRGKAVFNGKVYVRQDAQKTNAYQNNANIVLSDDASVFTKPELEIYADDVKCSHGTTTGQLDEAALFYLKSRGIGDENARRLLTTAFTSAVLEKIPLPALKTHVLELLHAEGVILGNVNDPLE